MQPVDGIFYTKDEETPLKTVEWINFCSFLFFYLRFFGVIIWFQSYPFDLDGQIDTLGFKLPSTVVESMSVVQLRGRNPPSLILMSVISPPEGDRERLNHQSSPVPSARLKELYLYRCTFSVADWWSVTIKHVAHPFSSSFPTKKAVFVISAQQEWNTALTSVYLNSVYRSLPHRKQFYREETQENVLQVMKHKLCFRGTEKHLQLSALA